MQATYSGADSRLQYLFQNAKSVSVTQTLAQGTKIGEITIDGTTTDLYAPDGGGGGSTVTCQPLVDEGTAIALFTIGQNTYTIYSPVSMDISYTDLVGDEIDVDDGQQPPVISYDQASYKIGNLLISNGDDYRQTSDTSVVSGKTYYARTDNYVPVTPSSGSNPQANGWYEYNGSAYVRTQDTTVQSGKTYYKLVPSYSPVTPQSGDNPSSEGWYELATTPIPIYAPPATAVTYSSNYNQGIHVGTLRVASISNDPNHESNPTIADSDMFEIIVPQGSQGGSIVSYAQLYPSTGEHIGTITIDGIAQSIYAPTGGSGDSVSWTATLQSGTEIGRLTIDGTENILYAPSGGGGGSVNDVQVDGTSVVDSNGIAHVDGKQDSIQADLDRIYNVCVSMGSTPPSHSFGDVMLTALYTIGGGMQYKEVESTLNMNMRYFGHAKEGE